MSRLPPDLNSLLGNFSLPPRSRWEPRSSGYYPACNNLLSAFRYKLSVSSSSFDGDTIVNFKTWSFPALNKGPRRSNSQRAHREIYYLCRQLNHYSSVIQTVTQSLYRLRHLDFPNYSVKTSIILSLCVQKQIHRVPSTMCLSNTRKFISLQKSYIWRILIKR